MKHDVKVRVDNEFSREMREALHREFYERVELAMVASYLDASDVVLEIGTGVGAIASFCARQIGSDRVYTFEANPKLASHIRRTFALNKVHPRLDMSMVAEHEGERDFYISENFWSSTPVGSQDKILERTRVPSKSFNDVVRRIHPTFLIVDIEGGEYELCRYANLESINKLLIEVHEFMIGADRTQMMLTSLNQAGFRIVQSIVDNNRVLMFERGEQ